MDTNALTNSGGGGNFPFPTGPGSGNSGSSGGNKAGRLFGDQNNANGIRASSLSSFGNIRMDGYLRPDWGQHHMSGEKSSPSEIAPPTKEIILGDRYDGSDGDVKEEPMPEEPKGKFTLGPKIKDFCDMFMSQKSTEPTPISVRKVDV